MRFNSLLVTVVTASLALAACQDEQRADANIASALADTSQNAYDEDSKPAYFQCGETLVVFHAGTGGKGNMQIANTSYAMEQTVSASGARYQNLSDDTTVFWNKGNKAWVTIDGNDLPECDETTKPVVEKPYRAQGNEPGWTVVIEKGVMTLNADYGETTATANILNDATENNIRTVTGDNDITVTIDQNKQCHDDMSGEAFAHGVTVRYGDKTYQGCGQSLIRYITWRLEDLDKGGIIDRSHLTMRLGEEGRIHGDSGCNYYTGQYSLEGENLSVNTNIAMTMRACMSDALMNQEQKFLSLLPKMNKATIDETGALVLTGDDNASLLFRQSDDE